MCPGIRLRLATPLRAELESTSGCKNGKLAYICSRLCYNDQLTVIVSQIARFITIVNFRLIHVRVLRQKCNVSNDAIPVILYKGKLFIPLFLSQRFTSSPR